MEIFNSQKLNGKEGPGNLAIIHRVGYAGQSRSHFNSQHYWQNADPGNKKLDEGMFYRQIVNTVDLNREENAFAAASLSGSQMVALRDLSHCRTSERHPSFHSRAAPRKIKSSSADFPASIRGFRTAPASLGFTVGQQTCPANRIAPRFTEPANYLEPQSKPFRMPPKIHTGLLMVRFTRMALLASAKPPCCLSAPTHALWA